MHNDEIEINDNIVNKMIIPSLRAGRTRHEIIALHMLDTNIFDKLEQHENYRKQFAKAETESFLEDLEELKSNFTNRNFNHSAAISYFVNRHSWSQKPNKIKLKTCTVDSVIEAMSSGEIDIDAALGVLKALSIKQDMQDTQENRDKIIPLITMLKKYKEDNNL